jgi:hypothetical protein
MDDRLLGFRDFAGRVVVGVVRLPINCDLSSWLEVPSDVSDEMMTIAIHDFAEIEHRTQTNSLARVRAIHLFLVIFHKREPHSHSGTVHGLIRLLRQRFCCQTTLQVRKLGEANPCRFLVCKLYCLSSFCACLWCQAMRSS